MHHNGGCIIKWGLPINTLIIWYYMYRNVHSSVMLSSGGVVHKYVSLHHHKVHIEFFTPYKCAMHQHNGLCLKHNMMDGTIWEQRMYTLINSCIES